MVPFLIRLIDAHWFEAATICISSGCDVNEYDAWGRSPLFAAAASKNLKLVEFLLLKGADVNAKLSANSYSPLMTVLRTFDPNTDDGAIVVALVRNGADVNATTRAGLSVYNIACASLSVPHYLKAFLIMQGAYKTAIQPKQVGNVNIACEFDT